MPSMPLMPLADYLALLAAITAMAFTPGPNTTLSTALAANLGLRRAMRFVVSVPVGWTLLLLLASFRAWPPLGWAIKAVGIGYMAWLALQLWRTQRLAEVDPARLHVGFRQGVALQFVNIKAWMAALMVTAGWVLPGPVAERLMVVAPTMIFYAFSSNFAYALVGALLRRWLNGGRKVGRRLQVFNRTMALVLLATAVWMAQV
jgi:threonine/homoserine/homoserine lactone efflux protein